ncbi:MAG: CHAP domain-containing protein [Polyangiaceae bacterium]|nr:CHAP domain-containing protein [Polyangiaceae bacterium]
MILRTTTAALVTLMLATFSACAPPAPDEEGDPSEDTSQSDDDALSGTEKIAALANDNVGNTACGENSLGGKGFKSSCTGNGGQPEYWCSDFARWTWEQAGADVDGLTAAAGSFYCYGEEHGTLSSTPHVGDAVVYNYQGNCWADHVALVTKVNPDGSIITVSGNWGGQSGSQAHFSSTSSVKINQPAYSGEVGSYSNVMGNTISGFISPAGLPKDAEPTGPEGGKAFLYPNQQHLVHSDGAGNIRHHWWDANENKVFTDTWGTGTAGEPVSFVHGTSQHVFARGTDGSLKHWFWDPANGPRNDVWAPAGSIAGDPAAIVIDDYEDVWAVDQGGKLQHWFWGPDTNGVKHDTWGQGVVGRPSVFVTKDGQQHAFARGTGGTLEHFWWTPGGGISHDTWGTGLAGDPAAITFGDFQAVWAVDGAGNLQHWYWGPNTNGVQHDTWGAGVVGRPSVFVTGNGEQHAFVRGKNGTVEHWWWAAGAGISHDVWGNGISKDPTAITIGAQQHLWALDAAGHAQHWFWDPASNSIKHDDWGK